MVWGGSDLEEHQIPPPCHSRDTSHHTLSCPKAPSSLVLSTARNGVATASLGSLGQDLSTLIETIFFLMSSLNLSSLSSKPLPLVLSLHFLIKVPLQLSYRPSLGTLSLEALHSCL